MNQRGNIAFMLVSLGVFAGLALGYYLIVSQTPDAARATELPDQLIAARAATLGLDLQLETALTYATLDALETVLADGGYRSDPPCGRLEGRAVWDMGCLPRLEDELSVATPLSRRAAALGLPTDWRIDLSWPEVAISAQQVQAYPSPLDEDTHVATYLRPETSIRLPLADPLASAANALSTALQLCEGARSLSCLDAQTPEDWDITPLAGGYAIDIATDAPFPHNTLFLRLAVSAQTINNDDETASSG